MGKQHIQITESFNAPVETIFKILTNHEEFGRVINAKIKRVVDSQRENKNGTGSVRRINAFPGISFEESVTAFEQNRFMEYTVSKGSPIKNHKGRMEFSEHEGITRLNYTIDFEPKLSVPFWGSILKAVIGKPIQKSLKQFAERFK